MTYCCYKVLFSTAMKTYLCQQQTFPLLYTYFLTQRDQNVVGLSHSSHAFILPASVDSLIDISVWANMYLTLTEFQFAAVHLGRYLATGATINTPAGTEQLTESPPCCNTSGNESKHSCKGKKRGVKPGIFLKISVVGLPSSVTECCEGSKGNLWLPQETESLLLPVPNRSYSAP